MAIGHAHVVTHVPPAAFTAAARERLKEMFEAHHELIWRAIRRQGFEPEVAADLAQQAFLIAAERLDDIRTGCERAFLLETGMRLARTASRRSNRVQLEEDMDLRITGAMRADDALDNRRATEVLDRVLAALTPDLRQVFLLFEVEGTSTPDIARLIGIPVGTVASRLRRAREAFLAEAARIEKEMFQRKRP
jgi:RNA polymerase sigma-70 factor, ECF subfamily